MSEATLAQGSCLSCRRLKRKCTKEIPQCALCRRVGRTCQYEASPSTPVSLGRESANDHPYDGSASFPRNSPRHSSTHKRHNISRDNVVSNISVCRQTFPAAWVLDSVVHRGSKAVLPEAIQWAELVLEPPSLTVEQAWSIANVHFESTHNWIPIGICSCHN
jgi:hypothetical protein